MSYSSVAMLLRSGLPDVGGVVPQVGVLEVLGGVEISLAPPVAGVMHMAEMTHSQHHAAEYACVLQYI